MVRKDGAVVLIVIIKHSVRSIAIRKKSVTEQLEEGIRFFSRKYPEMKYLAYFQAYTNTYDELSSLKAKYEEALSLSGVVGLIVGTRPDCMPDALLDYFTAFPGKVRHARIRTGKHTR